LTVYRHPAAGEAPNDEDELRRPGVSSDVTIIGLLDVLLPVSIAEARQSITAAGVAPVLAAALGWRPDAPILRIDRTYLTSDSQPVKLAISYFLPEQYS
jgi:GntR family transcriptional regulator